MTNLKKLLLLSTIPTVLFSSEILPQNVLTGNCLTSYKGKYQNLKEHKVFVYAREVETDKDRCNWNYSYDSVKSAKKNAIKACAKYQLNAECKVIDIDGKFIAKKGDFSFVEPVDNTPLTKERTKELMDKAKPIVLGNCYPFFEKYLKAKGYKSFAYSLDEDGKYACGYSYKNAKKKMSLKQAIKSCNTNKRKRGDKTPKSECKNFAIANKIVLEAKDYDIEIVAKSDKELSSEEFKSYYKKAEFIITDGACQYQMKYYLKGSQHQAFYLAQDKEGKQACGWSEGDFSLKVANENAKKACEKNIKKKKIDASCKLFVENFNFVAKAEDFGLKKGIEDFKQAIHHGNIQKVKQYIIEGADVNTQTKIGLTPLFLAAAQADEKFFDKLLEKNANYKQKLKDNSNLLMAAVLGQNPNIINKVLKLGISTDEKGTKGNTPLLAAFMSLNTYNAQILLYAGADPKIKNDKGISCYEFAKKWKLNIDEMKKFDPKKPDYDGTFPLFYASKYGDREMIKKLIKAGADKNHVDGYVYSPFSIAKDKETMELLLKLGCDINQKGADGQTPLMFVANGINSLKEVKALLSLGADKSIKNNEGKTAYDIAKDDKMVSEEVKNILKK